MHLPCLRILVSHYKGIIYTYIEIMFHFSQAGEGGGGGVSWGDPFTIYTDIIQSIFHEAILFYIIMYQHEHTCRPTYMTWTGKIQNLCIGFSDVIVTSQKHQFFKPFICLTTTVRSEYLSRYTK